MKTCTVDIIESKRKVITSFKINHFEKPYISQPMQIPIPLLPVKVYQNPKTYSITPQIKLKNVMFEITKECNLNCIHCYCNAGCVVKNELTTDEIIEFITQLSKDGVENITFTGGEPLLHKDLFFILKHASNCGLGITIFTNGTLLNEQVLDIITKINLISIQISLDGVNRETHDYIRGRRGVYNKVISAIKTLKIKGIKVIVMTTLMECNQDEIVGISRLCHELKVDAWCMNLFIPLGRALNLIEPQIEKMKNIHSNIGIMPAICNTTACGVGYDKIAVLSNGDICPCEVLQKNKIGNIRSDDLYEIFLTSSIMNEYRSAVIKNIKECKICEVKDNCRGGCKTSAFVRKGSLFSPDPINCLWRL